MHLEVGSHPPDTPHFVSKVLVREQQLLDLSVLVTGLFLQNHLEHVFIGWKSSRWQSILLLQPQEVEAV